MANDQPIQIRFWVENRHAGPSSLQLGRSKKWVPNDGMVTHTKEGLLKGGPWAEQVTDVFEVRIYSRRYKETYGSSMTWDQFVTKHGAKKAAE